MPRLRLCHACSDNLPADHPSRSENLLTPGSPGPVFHRLDTWPHEAPSERARPPAVHDDQSYRRAYGPGALAGLGYVPATRQEHREVLRTMGLAEGAPDTPGRAPSAVEIARKNRMFERAFERAKRKG